MGLKYKNSSGGWVQIPIPSEINDKMTSATSTYSSKKIEETYAKTADLPVQYDDTEIKKSIATKQDELVSGVNIKTYNGESILTAGDIVQPITMLTEDFNFDELPLGTRGMYLTVNDNIVTQFNGHRYSTRRFYLFFFSYLSSTQKILSLISTEGISQRAVKDNILTTIRNAFINEEDYNENKIRTCYSDVKVDKLLENIRELPAVTTSDNDKILKVVDGVWTAVTLANGDEVSY